MNRFCTRVGAAMTMAATFILAPPAQAFVVDPREISLLLESTLVDIDMMMIDVHYGPQRGNRLTYLSRIDQYGWNGRLFGSHGGRDISVRYAGFLTPLDMLGEDYAISYTSSWTVDGMSGAGFGSGFSIDPHGKVSIDLSGSVSGNIGLSYGLVSVSIDATKDLVNERFDAGVTIGAGTVPLLNVSAISARGGFTYFQVTGDYRSVLEAELLGFIPLGSTVVNSGNIISVDPPYPPPPEDEESPPVMFEDVEAGFVFPDGCQGFICDPPIPGYNIGETGTTVPEPASWLMFIIGFGITGGAVRRQRRSLHLAVARTA